MSKTCPTCGQLMPGLPSARRGRPPVRHPACARAFENQREAERMRRNRSEVNTRRERLDLWHQIRSFLYQPTASPLELLMLSEEE